MSNALLALFSRAVREDVRSRATYWARAALVGIVLLVLGTTHANMGWAGAPGLVFFTTITFINLLFISLTGLSYFSSAITEEKEEMTLGLLRMTNLNPLSILLGKSASRQVGALLLLVSQLPFTLLAIALGGVTIWQILAAYTCLAAYTLFLGNLALFYSVMARRTAHAAIFTSATLFVFLFGPWIIQWPILSMLKFFTIIDSAKPGPRLEAFLTNWEQSSPIARLQEIVVTGFNGGPICFQVVSNALLGVGFFLGAWGIFDIFCNEQPDAAPSRGLLFRGVKRMLFVTPGRSWRRALFWIFVPGRTWRRALLWKDFHFLGGGHGTALGKLIAYGGLLGAILLTQHRDDTAGIKWETFGYVTIWTMLFAFSVEAAFGAARVFRHERVWKTWSSLAMLPISTRRIAYQKILGCLISCWPAVFFFTVGCALVADDVLNGLVSAFRKTTPNSGIFNWVAITVFIYSILQTLLFYHLVANLSLRLKWGALPLSIVIVYVGNAFVAMLGVLMFREAAFIILAGVSVVLIALLHIDIGRRLEQIAGED